MALQDFTLGASVAEPELAAAESLVVATQGQILRNDEAVEATFHVTNRRVMASPHYGGEPIEMALYAEVESAKLERRSIITGVVTLGDSRFLVPQSHGDAFIDAFQAYQDVAGSESQDRCVVPDGSTAGGLHPGSGSVAENDRGERTGKGQEGQEEKKE